MKRFVIFQTLALVALGLYWTVGPKQHVASAQLSAVAHAPSEISLGDYAPADDTQITGTVGRGFHDRRVAAAVVQQHPELGMDAAAITTATTVSINSFSRTINLNVAAASPQRAVTIAAALLEARRALDSKLWQETKAADLQRVDKKITALAAQLHQLRATLQTLGDDIGDPLEREARLRERFRKASAIEGLKADMTVRSNQYHNMLELLATAIDDLRSGRAVPPSSGFELSETTGMQKGWRGSANLVSKRSSGIAEAWSELLINTTERAALEAVYGGSHPQVIAAVAMQTGSRNRLLVELSAQKEAFGVANESLQAATAWLDKEMTAVQEEVRALSTSRFNPDYVKLRQTISGLESAYRKAVGQRQMLASAALTNPPQFYVVEPPSDIELPTQPTLMACVVAAQIAVMVLLWLTSPWAQTRSAKV